ncbi:hypothetical protein LTR36_006494 [Oleoguttula mirabilis]|uniref:tripeptidyl-peptidase II n=1 Tax=Oleoguttula mirabilis TaxID=1507867 RepID=A0AAV9JUV1_9PEZI|nr:hypothetical protein LTR36_006494 [Oleoguttula mirabilis]
MLVFGAAVLLLPSIGAASPITPYGYELHEARPNAGRNLHRRTASVHPDAVIPVQIGLTQSNLDEGYNRLMDVSHPTSSGYGKHLSAAEVNNIFAPHSDSVAAVRQWLAQATNVNESDILLSLNKGWLAVDLPVRAAERAFSTRYYEFEDSKGHLRIGCDAYYLPRHLRAQIDYVVPGVKPSPALTKRTLKRSSPSSGPQTSKRPPYFGPQHHGPWHVPPGAQDLPPDLQACGRNITPPCIRALYGIPVAHLNDSANSLGIYEGGDYYAQADLDSFFTRYAPNIPNGTAPVPAFIDGAQAPVALNDSGNTGESDIDAAMSLSLIYPQTITLYQTDDEPQIALELESVLLGFLNTFLDALDGSYCNYTYDGLTGDSPGLDAVYPDPLPGGYKGALQCGIYQPTRVISISYGEAENDVPVRYQKRQCNEFMKLALQGHTILLASGDFGVASFPGDVTESGCLSAAGQNATIYNPDLASSCPFITSVGGTQLLDNQTVLDAESALQVNLGPGLELVASGGGFSNRYPVPAYQKAAISAYFADHDPGLPYYFANDNASNIGANGGVYNRAGKGFPDVSANAANFMAYRNGTDSSWYGTSLAAPLWASVITLINEERTAVGKGPVGFINPVLYGNPGALRDITNGSNPNCGSAGFAAVPGWDPVTGLGTPDYPKLLELFMSLP